MAFDLLTNFRLTKQRVFMLEMQLDVLKGGLRKNLRTFHAVIGCLLPTLALVGELFCVGTSPRFIKINRIWSLQCKNMKTCSEEEIM